MLEEPSLYLSQGFLGVAKSFFTCAYVVDYERIATKDFDCLCLW